MVTSTFFDDDASRGTHCLEISVAYSDGEDQEYDRASRGRSTSWGGGATRSLIIGEKLSYRFGFSCLRLSDVYRRRLLLGLACVLCLVTAVTVVGLKILHWFDAEMCLLFLWAPIGGFFLFYTLGLSCSADLLLFALLSLIGI
jgi:hypothetical protein